MIADEVSAKRLAVPRLERADDLRGLGLGPIEERLFEALNRSEALPERLERGNVLRIAGRSREGEEEAALTFLGVSSDPLSSARR